MLASTFYDRQAALPILTKIQNTSLKSKSLKLKDFHPSSARQIVLQAALHWECRRALVAAHDPVSHSHFPCRHGATAVMRQGVHASVLHARDAHLTTQDLK